MQKFPKISVITPSLNQGMFIEYTIKSVLQQEYPNLEYIIIDGGSIDGSIEVINRYENYLATWISEPDSGQVNAINKGMRIATGDILAWLNSDDTYEPGALHTIANEFIKNPEARFVYGEGWYIDENNRRIRPCKFIKPKFNTFYILNHDPTLQSATFWTRDLWHEVGELNENLQWVFDWDWYIRANKSTTFHYTPHFLSNYRIQRNAKSRIGGMDRLMEMAEVTRKYGKWWYPNNIVQQIRYFDHKINQATEKFPQVIKQIIHAPFFSLKFLVERIFNDYYRN